MRITFGQSIYRNRTIDLRLKVKWEGIKYKLGLDFFFFFFWKHFLSQLIYQKIFMHFK
jgi:hypothetical protein